MIRGHGGNIDEAAALLGVPPSEIIDMSSNLNPLGPFPGLMEHLSDSLKEILHLPEVDGRGIIHKFAEIHGLPEEAVLCGNGTTQFIHTLPEALKKAFGVKNAVISGPTYADYTDACLTGDVRITHVTATAENNFKPDLYALSRAAENAEMVFICTPNNPTGTLITDTEIRDLAEHAPDVFFVVDESYLAFSDKSASLISKEMKNIIVLHSFSKIYRIPGLRIGFMIAEPKVIEAVRPHILPWSVNSLAQTAVHYILDRHDRVAPFVNDAVAFLKKEKKRVMDAFEHIDGIRFFESETSYLIAQAAPPHSAEIVKKHVLRDKLLIRNCGNFIGLDESYFRVSLKTSDINDRIINRLLLLFKPN